MTQEGPALGFIGLGAMGGGMAMRLVRAGYPLTVYDLKPERLSDCLAAGAVAAGGSGEVAQRSEIVLTSLRSSAVFVEVAENELLPAARAGQVFMDMGTTEAPETRRLSAALAARGAALVDAPVSGGPGGAAAGTLHIFVGGDEAVVEKVRPVLEVLGEPRHIARCGPSGCGQAVKGVNQLAMGLVAAAYLEAIAFGVRAGADLDAIATSVGGEEGWRKRLADYAMKARDGSAEHVYVKFPELPYFLREARDQGFEMPMTQALFRFCDAGPRNWRDNMGRECVAFWHQLMQAAPSK